MIHKGTMLSIKRCEIKTINLLVNACQKSLDFSRV